MQVKMAEKRKFFMETRGISVRMPSVELEESARGFRELKRRKRRSRKSCVLTH